MSENLTKLLALMIPADSGRGLPSGAQLENFVQSIQNGNRPDLTAAGEEIAATIRNLVGIDIGNMEPSDFSTFVKSHRHAIDTPLWLIGIELLKNYYTDPRVQDAVGASSRAPFPHGIQMPENNLDLLEDVYNRGSIYRKVLHDH
jgi:hypothetical protein